MLKISTKVNLIFLLFAALWGLTFPVTKLTVSHLDPWVFTLLRFLLAALCCLPFTIKKLHTLNSKIIKVSLILGCLNSGIYSLEAFSLKYISSPRCAFITGANVILVPFICKLFFSSKITIADITAGVVCLFGLYILTGAKITGIHYGDILALSCALLIAISISYVHHISSTMSDYEQITFLQILFACPVPAIFLLTNNSFTWSQLQNLPVALSILFCAILATTVPLLGQIKLQKYTTATITALIFSLEPVFATIFSVEFFSETPNTATLVGGTLMFISVLIPIIYDEYVTTKVYSHD